MHGETLKVDNKHIS